jgi:5-hydroxyisourate hydrolase
MISTHVLDLNSGMPARGVQVTLEKQSGKDWEKLSDEETNSDGRIVFSCESKAGIYRLTFQLENYFTKNKIEPFFVVAPITFKISDIKRKYHVPLLLSSYGYSTYRGS